MESRPPGAPDDEPEHLPPVLRAPAPPKIPLEDFLKEFEERLRANPAEAATGAGRALDDRASGNRRSPVEAQASHRQRFPRGWSPAARGRPDPAPAAPLTEAPEGGVRPRVTPAAATPAQPTVPRQFLDRQDHQGAGAATPAASEPGEPGAATDPTAEGAVDERRHRNRRRKHRRHH